MNKPIIISINRKLAIGLGVAILLLATFSCSYFFFDHEDKSPEHVFNISIASDKTLRKGTERDLEKLLPKGVTGLVLVSEGEKGESPVFTPLARDGTPKNFCGQKTECKLDTEPGTFGRLLAATPADLGFCYYGDQRKNCHKSGDYKHKWPYWPSGTHKKCTNDDGCT